METLLVELGGGQESKGEEDLKLDDKGKSF